MAGVNRVSNAAIYERIEAIHAEVKRLADEMARMNGTVRGLCEWRAGIDERHRQEETKAEPTKLADVVSKRVLIAVAVGMALAGAGGGALLQHLIELLK